MNRLILYIWQLPQNLLGLLLRLILRGERCIQVSNIVVFYLRSFPGGISLGNTIILNTADEFSAKHEYGHCRQSKILGWFYLPVIGIPSLFHAAWWKPGKGDYYSFFTERWPNELGGLKPPH